MDKKLYFYNDTCYIINMKYNNKFALAPVVGQYNYSNELFGDAMTEVLQDMWHSKAVNPMYLTSFHSTASHAR